MAIYIDPETGIKTFNTRAAKSLPAITGQGYGVITD